jgi:hypothetical protein
MPFHVNEHEVLAVDQDFHPSTLFPSKLEMPSYMKVVSLNKLDNFHIGRF